MHLQPHQLYHVYNRGNNRNLLFYDRNNYFDFLGRIEKYIVPNCHLLTYSLLPNHFHLQIMPNELTNEPYQRINCDTIVPASSDGVHLTKFSRGLQMLLSSYAKSINKRYKRRGSLFTQNTHIKMTSSESFEEDYSLWCFSYIHYNPVAAGLVNSPDAWTFSSFREYLGKESHPLCDVELGKKVFSLDINDLYRPSWEIPDHIYHKIH